MSRACWIHLSPAYKAAITFVHRIEQPPSVTARIAVVYPLDLDHLISASASEPSFWAVDDKFSSLKATLFRCCTRGPKSLAMGSLEKMVLLTFSL